MGDGEAYAYPVPYKVDEVLAEEWVASMDTGGPLDPVLWVMIYFCPVANTSLDCRCHLKLALTEHSLNQKPWKLYQDYGSSM